ncbi:MAG: hypothetical protein SPL99_10355 [Catonella sp.]|nr:hypothetical protein [Catonella sp.]MDY6357251.1 hypothetical protein [Catonella sp.]
MKIRNRFLTYLGITAFFAAFGMIYEYFSFGVFSPFMAFGFMIPLVLGVLPSFVIWRIGKEASSTSVHELYMGGVIMLTFGSIVRGVVEIYGTTNGKLIIYPILGLAMILETLVMNHYGKKRLR